MDEAPEKRPEETERRPEQGVRPPLRNAPPNPDLEELDYSHPFVVGLAEKLAMYHAEQAVLLDELRALRLAKKSLSEELEEANALAAGAREIQKDLRKEQIKLGQEKRRRMRERDQLLGDLNNLYAHVRAAVDDLGQSKFLRMEPDDAETYGKVLLLAVREFVAFREECEELKDNPPDDIVPARLVGIELD